MTTQEAVTHHTRTTNCLLNTQQHKQPQSLGTDLGAVCLFKPVEERPRIAEVRVYLHRTKEPFSSLHDLSLDPQQPSKQCRLKQRCNDYKKTALICAIYSELKHDKWSSCALSWQADTSQYSFHSFQLRLVAYHLNKTNTILMSIF